MANVVENFQKFYNELVQDYSGKWVLVSENKVIFADSSFDVVYEVYFSKKDSIECEMILVDDGEASFY